MTPEPPPYQPRRDWIGYAEQRQAQPVTAPRCLPLAEPTEKHFTNQIIQLAQLYGWRTAHFRPALTRGGRWTTAVQGDGAGFPDIIAVRGDRLLVAELKVGRRKPTLTQTEWLDAFRGAGLPAFLWTPRDWPEIEKVLK